MSFVIANNISTTLASAASSTATTLTLASSTGLPTLGSGQIMPLTLNDAATGQVYEVVYVTAISGVTLTVERAQEGTGAQNWSIGDYAFCAYTAGAYNNAAFPNSPTMPTPSAGDSSTKGSTTAYASKTGSVVGSTRNLRASLTTAGTSVTFTADEIVVETALGGAPYRLASFSEAINVATTGAGGMDTGSAPASGYVAIYAIYNPTTSTAALLATNATAAAAPNVYGGANMPAGYTLSGLISVWPTNGSGQLGVGVQQDRWVSFPFISVYSSTSPPTSPTSLSITSAVPKNARGVRGNLFIGAATTANSYAISVAADASGSGVQPNAGYLPSGGSSSSAFSLGISTPQTIYQWNSGTPTTGTTWGINLCAYEI